jgi:hypothetical protein
VHRRRASRGVLASAPQPLPPDLAWKGLVYFHLLLDALAARG